MRELRRTRTAVIALAVALTAAVAIVAATDRPEPGIPLDPPPQAIQSMLPHDGPFDTAPTWWVDAIRGPAGDIDAIALEITPGGAQLRLTGDRRPARLFALVNR